MPNEMIERVAKAIKLRDTTDEYAMARAAIQAMREPTEIMQLAALLTCVYENKGIEYSPSFGWKAMIDAVINE